MITAVEAKASSAFTSSYCTSTSLYPQKRERKGATAAYYPSAEMVVMELEQEVPWAFMITSLTPNNMLQIRRESSS